jgi:ubiquinone/menaquinone biosynthesis C-methylase UbiE
LALPTLIKNRCRTVIDLGCGVGWFVNVLRECGVDARGITYQKEEAKGHKYIDVGDLHELPYRDDSFDGMVMWDALEHTQSPYIALCEARRVVKPGGCGTVFIPGKFWWDCKYHIICPNILQMTHLTNISGWSPKEMIDLSQEGLAEDDPADKHDQMAVYYMVNE